MRLPWHPCREQVPAFRISWPASSRRPRATPAISRGSPARCTHRPSRAPRCSGRTGRRAPWRCSVASGSRLPLPGASSWGRCPGRARRGHAKEVHRTAGPQDRPGRWRSCRRGTRHAKCATRANAGFLPTPIGLRRHRDPHRHWSSPSKAPSGSAFEVASGAQGPDVSATYADPGRSSRWVRRGQTGQPAPLAIFPESPPGRRPSGVHRRRGFGRWGRQGERVRGAWR
jgi:hypothetical protein